MPSLHADSGRPAAKRSYIQDKACGQALPGFRFHWMSEFPVWNATMAGLSEPEQTELMRRACSEAQPETEANQRHMVQFKMLPTACCATRECHLLQVRSLPGPEPHHSVQGMWRRQGAKGRHEPGAVAEPERAARRGGSQARKAMEPREPEGDGERPYSRPFYNKPTTNYCAILRTCPTPCQYPHPPTPSTEPEVHFGCGRLLIRLKTAADSTRPCVCSSLI